MDRFLLALVGLAISFAVPAAMAQDAMKVVTTNELVWKEHPVLKGAQTVILVGDPTKAETSAAHSSLFGSRHCA
jgi:hypothetical protein